MSQPEEKKKWWESVWETAIAHVKQARCPVCDNPFIIDASLLHREDIDLVFELQTHEVFCFMQYATT